MQKFLDGRSVETIPPVGEVIPQMALQFLFSLPLRVVEVLARERRKVCGAPRHGTVIEGEKVAHKNSHRPTVGRHM